VREVPTNLDGELITPGAIVDVQQKAGTAAVEPFFAWGDLPHIRRPIGNRYYRCGRGSAFYVGRCYSPAEPHKSERLMITITGTVGSAGKYLVTGIPVDTKANAVLKIAFENNTPGTNLALLAGTDADFGSPNGGMHISDSAVQAADS
jgi:hypothetical protein